MFYKFKKFVFALAACATFTAAQATLVDFEDIPSLSTSRFVIQDKGLTFTGINMDVLGPEWSGYFVKNGTTTLMTNHYFSTTVTATSGDLFSLNQLDIALIFILDQQAQEYASLVGYFSDGSSISTDLLVSASSYQTFNLTGFENLKSIVVSKRELGNGSLGFDNFDFDVQAVPEPGSLALLGLGLVGLVLARRRKRVCSRHLRNAAT